MRQSDLDVEPLGYKEALEKHGEHVDIIICSWMPREENWMPIILEASPEEFIAIGEMDVYGKGNVIRDVYGDYSLVEYLGYSATVLETPTKYVLCSTDFGYEVGHSEVISLIKSETAQQLAEGATPNEIEVKELAEGMLGQAAVDYLNLTLGVSLYRDRISEDERHQTVLAFQYKDRTVTL
jgi:hypothetical protein